MEKFRKISLLSLFQARASAEKFPGGPTEKRPQNSKKDRKNSAIKPLPRGPTEKRPKSSKNDQKQHYDWLWTWSVSGLMRAQTEHIKIKTLRSA